MSLNGLDNPQLAEAHDAVSAEPGGWFLLKYATRDQVELLGRGNGGITEVRAAVAAYPDTSPLFGFLKYRRRNVVIKYLPDGCSRLIQARVAVHFNAVCERLSPYDITFEIEESDELRDTRLSAACSLHAASNSNTSSTSSLRKKRLGEIAEEDEDEQRATKRQSLTHDDSAEAVREATAATADPVTLNAELAASPEQSKFSAANTSELPNFVGVDSQRPSTSSAATVAPDTASTRRLSSQTLRPELFASSSYTYGKPKIKLGPRPSADAGNPRPQTAGNFRPVSTIPAGLKLFGKNAKKGRRSDDAASITSATSPTEEGPEMTFPPIAGGGGEVAAERPTTSSGISTVSTITAAPMPVPAKGTVSKERARLMKAKQLREKKKMMGLQAGGEPMTPTTPTAMEFPVSENAPSTGENDDGPKNGVEVAKEDTTTEPMTLKETGQKRLSIIKADSAVVVEVLSSPVNTDEASELTQTDSRPHSPVVASPEPGQSTKASSLSESTDETVQPKNEGTLGVEDEAGTGHSADGEQVGETAEPVSKIETQIQEVEVAVPVRTEELAIEPVLAEKVSQAQHAQPEDNTSAETVFKHQAVEQTNHVLMEKTSPDVTEAPVLQEEPANATILQEPIAATPDDSEETVDEVETDAVAEVEEDKAEAEHKPKDNDQKSDSPPDQEDDGPLLRPDVYDPTAAPTSTSRVADTRTSDEIKQDVEAPTSNISAPIPPSEPEKDMTSSTQPETPEIPQPTPTATEDERASPLKIPKSKFSTQDLRAASKAAASIPSEPVPSARTADAASQESDTAAAPRPARRNPLDPIRTDVASHSRASSRSSASSVADSLMDELQSATVEEAKPMFVAKTPITPAFPGLDGAPPTPKAHMVRTVSNPLRGSLVAPSDVSQSSARSLSMGAAYLHKVTTQQQAAGNLAKKANMGSGISQRIKALEMLSAEQGGGSQKSSRGDRPSSTFFSVKKSREASRSPSVVDRASSFTKNTPSPAVESRDSSPETSHPRRDRSGSMASRLSIFESPPGAPGQSPGNKPRGRPESISVTARIIRDPNQGIDSPRNPSEYNHLALKQSPLLVDHQRATPERAAPRESTYERRSSRDSHRSGTHDLKDGKSRRSSMSIVKDFIKERRRSITSSSGDALAAPPGANSSRSPSRPPSTHQNSGSFTHRLSMSSRRSLSRDRDVLSPSVLTESSLSGDESKSSVSGDKKKSRAGRFMRRLSSLSGSRGKISTLPGISPTVAEEDSLLSPEPHQAAALARPSTTGTPAIVSYLGDVNVQFPDTLLWKRRNMCLDASGFLILSALPAQNGRPAQTGTKRYHLSEFRAPYTPDVEVQELPNSVVLDLREGSGVQVACEDRSGQMAVLQVLQEAHAAHAAGFGI